MAKNKEIRSIELRSINDDAGTMVLEGYAVVFGQETLIGDNKWGWYETIDEHALDNADMKDVPLKYNHGDGSVPILARTRNKSLELTVDEHGLKIRATLLDTQDSKDIYKRIEAGLLDKMSFAFTCVKSEWTEGRDGQAPKRRIMEIDKLFDVSIVDMPAYDGTEINARSREMAGYEKPVENKGIDLETRLLIMRWAK